MAAFTLTGNLRLAVKTRACRALDRRAPHPFLSKPYLMTKFARADLRVANLHIALDAFCKALCSDCPPPGLVAASCPGGPMTTNLASGAMVLSWVVWERAASRRRIALLIKALATNQAYCLRT